MPLMKLGKNRVFATTLGHVIRFTKDEEVNVPDICVKVCEGIGAVFVGEAPAGHINEDEIANQVAVSINRARNAENIPPEPIKAQPTAPGDRLEAVIASARTIIEHNDHNDFTAAGSINLKVLAKHTGFRVDKSELVEAMTTINDPD